MFLVCSPATRDPIANQIWRRPYNYSIAAFTGHVFSFQTKSWHRHGLGLLSLLTVSHGIRPRVTFSWPFCPVAVVNERESGEESRKHRVPKKTYRCGWNVVDTWYSTLFLSLSPSRPLSLSLSRSLFLTTKVLARRKKAEYSRDSTQKSKSLCKYRVFLVPSSAATGEAVRFSDGILNGAQRSHDTGNLAVVIARNLCLPWPFQQRECSFSGKKTKKLLRDL